MRDRPTPLLVICACAAAACAGSSPQPPRSAREPVAARAPAPAAPAGPAQPRRVELGADATFGDLARAAAARISAGESRARAECLLSARPDGHTLDAELMPALHELPEPQVELDAALQRARGPIRVLTAWGQLGAIDPQLGLAAFTALSPRSLRRAAVALITTDQGVYLRYSDGAAGDADGPLAIAAVVPRLLSQPRAADAVLYVGAEADVPLAAVAELLRALPHGRSVALAQVLPPGTRLPELTAAPPPAQTCPDGLPEPAAGSVEGELDARAILDALGPLRAGAGVCLETATAAARAGGRLVLALRVAADGAVQEACLMQDGIGDAALAACVLQSARATRLPAPDPGGFVDVHVPLSLTPQTLPEPRAICE